MLKYCNVILIGTNFMKVTETLWEKDAGIITQLLVEAYLQLEIAGILRRKLLW